MSVAKVTEISCASSKSFEDAIEKGIERADKTLDKVKGAWVSEMKVEVDDGDNMKLAGHYKLRGFPTIIMFVNGEEVGRFGGAKPAPEVRKFIDQHLPL